MSLNRSLNEGRLQPDDAPTDTRPHPRCDMSFECTEPVTMLDDKGFAYCTGHGIDRKVYGYNCRKLRQHELRRLQRGEQITHY